ncbi:hypothetical protein EI427_20985 [Flammeovirga pectinis]|uniref:Uncharacterized protein n=1 Tax=Flammeovirga pectinis TaxID=2494373 RepID=A0A3Q9FRG6_9BACT|nr:hypothetical protein [Flammeovirga pectinis]AZQ64702.1 hypothetical protein EI427_20985 [Flammeovirga pectinis]
MKNITLLLVALSMLSACDFATKHITTNQPIQSEYKMGEQWVWHWERAVDGHVRDEGRDTQKVVRYNGDLGFWNGIDTVLVAKTLLPDNSATPFRDWPLFVGKKWQYESTWENNEGTTGKTAQDVEVVAYEALKVKGGTFKAYKLIYQGIVTNSRGFKGEMTDTWWYAPELKTYIKHINEDGHGVYTNELISYTNATAL